MAVPENIERLVEQFDRYCDAYRSGAYNETQLRNDFLDPLWEALGWDMHNRAGYPEQYRDVIYEDSIKIGGATKAPDYAFRIGGARKFFLEAKRPSVSIRDDVSPAYQLRRYAWSAKLPLSVLSDFEEFAVYDTRVRPVKNDNPAVARTLYMPYTEYPERWDEIASIFSKEAILQGAFDKYAEETARRGTAEVDDAFLQEIERWRDLLARNMALRNPSLTQRELNFAVQRTIDRIIFLRICEDRGIEEYGRLQRLVSGEEVYRRLLDLYRQADERYNSGLFHFQLERDRDAYPDELTPTLAIDDKVLRDIIGNLYYPDSPYEFSVLPADILGQVYEQFLGKVIRLTPSHRAVVEEKPEVRKAGGVYYTPTYIVDYIVKHTVGNLVADKTPRGVARLKIVDPACGSGSFLLGAYEFLLAWHRDHYVADGPENHSRHLYQGPGGEWRLTSDERKRILLNNIYGVDIDPQAVEVTKLSLLLKMLEGESEQTLVRQLQFTYAERVLPDLEQNVKCGNSLIGQDFYDQIQVHLFDGDAQVRMNVLDWDHAFPLILNRGGFDAVIGNPPYLNIRLLTQIQGDAVKKYFDAHYSAAKKGYDIYVVFLEQGLELLKAGGTLGMIVPNKIGTLDYAREIRRLLLEATIETIADVSELRVFGDASVYPYIITCSKRPPTKKHEIAIIHAEPESQLDSEVQHQVLQSTLSAELGFTIHGELDIEARVATAPLSQRANLHSGTTGFAAEDMAQSLIEQDIAVENDAFEFIVSGNIDRYEVRLGNVRFMKRRFTRPVLSRMSDLTPNKMTLFSGPKIVIAGMTKRIEAAYDTGGLALGVQVYAASDLVDDHRYLLGLLNSKLLTYIFRLRFRAKHLAGGYLAINKGQLEQLPVRLIDPTDQRDQSMQQQLVDLVDEMNRLIDQKPAMRTPHERQLLASRVDMIDRRIDHLVYRLYCLNEDEIDIVEGEMN